MDFKMIKGEKLEEWLTSIDGWIESLSRKCLLKTPDEKLASQVATLAKRLRAIENHLGVVVERGEDLTVRKVKLVENQGAIDVNNESSAG